MSDPSHAAHAVQVPEEPKTPTWLTVVGVVLFASAGIYWLASAPPNPTLSELAPPPPAASAAAQAAAPPAPPPPAPPAPAAPPPAPAFVPAAAHVGTGAAAKGGTKGKPVKGAPRRP